MVEREGRLITKDELLERVWPRMVVEDNALQAQISRCANSRSRCDRDSLEERLSLHAERRARRRGAAPACAAEEQPAAAVDQLHRSRDGDCADQAVARQTRLLTLTGAGGCGKTRLAIQVAQSQLEAHPDGIWFVEFASLADPSLVPHTVAAALGLQEGPGQTVTEAIAQHLSASRPLLLLDNAEHLAAAVAALVDELLGHCAHAIF